MTGRAGATQVITRPGYEVTVAGPGAAPSQPFPAPPGTIARLLALLDGRPGRHGSASTVPSDAGSARYGDLLQPPPSPPGDFAPVPLPPVDVLPPVPIGREPRPGGLGGGMPGVR